MHSTTEEEVIREVSARLWSAEETDLGLASPLSQGALLRLLTPHNRCRVGANIFPVSCKYFPQGPRAPAGGPGAALLLRVARHKGVRQPGAARGHH